MDIRLQTRTLLHATLARAEWFERRDRNDRPYLVAEIVVSRYPDEGKATGELTASLRGPLLKADGEVGRQDRYSSETVDDLPEAVREAIEEALS